MAAAIPCPLSHPRHGKYALPHKVLKSRPKRCLEASLRIERPAANLDSDVRYHVSVDGLPYFTKGQYITTNNLQHRTVRLAFDKAVSIIEGCLASHNVALDRYEITIILRCISLRRFKFRYYMIDHERKRVGSIHGEPIVVRDERIPTEKWVGYWEHMAKFPTHRFCSSVDYDYAVELLNSMRAAELDPTVAKCDDATVDTLSNMLRVFDQRVMDEHSTASVAKTLRKIFEHSVAEHHTNLVPQRMAGAMQSLYGSLSALTDWAHTRAHKENNVSKCHHPSYHETPDDSPRSSAYDGPNRSSAEGGQQPDFHHRTGRRADEES